MNNQQIKTLVGIVQADRQGTAFLIDRERALAASHTFHDHEDGQEVDLELITLNVSKKAILTLFPDSQVALLTLTTPIDDIHLEFPVLYACNLKANQQAYQSFGYPEWKRTDGQPLSGYLMNRIDRPQPNDLELFSGELKGDSDMRGASGAPLFLGDGVHGVIVTNDQMDTLGAVSFQQCIPFLRHHNIPFQTLPPLLPFEEAILSKGEGLGRIGYEDGENLPYQETMASWRILSHSIMYEDGYDRNPQPLAELIEQYYRRDVNKPSKRIFFVVADFGKGKSTFLKQYTSVLAKQYRDTRTGFIPVYFNLREYNDYQPSHDVYGCIGSYLNELCGYDVVDDPAFRKCPFIFLIDSLDESGSLEKQDIERVILSVKKINSLGPATQNRIVVASRPISGVLERIIHEYEPYENERGQLQYASIFGFTSEQRDRYFFQLSDLLDLEHALGFNKELIRHIKDRQSIAALLNGVINEEEWRRPILAYMIFKLLQQHKEIQQGHRVGVYLSFINLLSKEAKHIGNKEMETRLLTEITHRNLLYATAILWLRNRSHNGKSYLHLQDLIDIWGIPNATHYRFLSHTYLEKNQDKYFFSHQSFAEMLIAEYYLRVFVYAAFQPQANPEAIRSLLLIGEPTPQTMYFYQGLLDLLIQSSGVGSTSEDQLLECRKMLFPIIASLGLSKEGHKRVSDLEMDSYLYCDEIDHIFKMDELDAYKTLSDGHVQSWPITHEVIRRIGVVCREIIGAPSEFASFEFQPVAFVPFNQLGQVTEKKWATADLDRWIALLTGERCNNGPEHNQAFIGADLSFNVLSMFKSHNQLDGISHPLWIDTISGVTNENENEYGNREQIGFSIRSINIMNMNFEGIQMQGAEIDHSRLLSVNFGGINGRGMRINGGYLNNVRFPKTMLKGSEFLGATMVDVDFYGAILHGAKIHECLLHRVNFERAEFFGAELTANYIIDVISLNGVRLSGCRVWNWIDKESFERCQEDIRRTGRRRFKVISMDEAVDVVGRRMRDSL